MDTTLKGRNKWANAHSYYALDILRMALGAFFIYKGYTFITESRSFEDLIAPVSNFLGGMWVFQYIEYAHFVGGIMIIAGLLTRWAIIAQLPIIIGAVLINFFGEMNVNNLMIATVTLIVCLFFVYYGSGKHSTDYYFKMEK